MATTIAPPKRRKVKAATKSIELIAEAEFVTTVDEAISYELEYQPCVQQSLFVETMGVLCGIFCSLLCYIIFVSASVAFYQMIKEQFHAMGFSFIICGIAVSILATIYRLTHGKMGF